MNDQIGEPYISIISSAKKDLFEKTNIETSKEEMACLDNFLFRCWQMGWLKQYEPKKEEGWDKAIKEAKEKYGYGKPEERIDVIRDLPRGEAEQKKEEKKKRPCEKCLHRVGIVAGNHKAFYCSRFSQPIGKDRETCIEEKREKEMRTYKEFSGYLDEAEQKKEEEKEVKVDMSDEMRERLEKLAPMSIIKIGWKAEVKTSPYDGSITGVSFCEVVDGYTTKEEALIAFVEEQKGKKYGDNFLPPEGYTNGKERKIMERLEALEKKVEALDDFPR